MTAKRTKSGPKKLSSRIEQKPTGVVCLVGAGPGDPGLLTFRAFDLLQVCDAVVYDYLAHPMIIAAAPEHAERIYVGKQAGRHTLPQADINQLLIDLARQGKIVVRLKGGDPYIFGRGGEEAEQLAAAGVPFVVAPGVTAAAGAAAYAGIPLTHRDYASSVTFITGHEDPTQAESDIPWDLLAQGGGTLVFYMGVGQLPRLVKELTRRGRAPRTPVALVEWATLPRQRVVTGTLADIVERAREASVKPPALIIVGDVVKLRKTLNWFERRPLFGKRVIVTRARHQASELTLVLEAYGAEVIEFPTIRIAPPADEKPLRAAASVAGGYDWIIFTSVNAVDLFFAAVLEETGDIRSLGAAYIAAIGPATREAVERYHLAVTLQPKRFIAEEVVAELKRSGGIAGARVLIPRAEEAREVLPEGLREAGANVDVVPVYRTVAEKPENAKEIVAELEKGMIDIVTFTSSSTVTNFVKAVGARRLAKIKEHTVFASIGPITSQTLRENGLEPAIEAKDYTIEGLVNAIVRKRNILKKVG
jgi:uroporphyrinogen III methyltransferase/synthase